MSVIIPSKFPDDETIAWFEKHIGPRTHYTSHSIGGKGWRFSLEKDNPFSAKSWYLTVDDEKMLTYYLLVK